MFYDEDYIYLNVFYKVMSEKKSKKDTHSYEGWLNSNSFLKRAFACLGYQIVATLVIYGIILGIVLVFVILFGLVGLISGA